MGKDPAFLFYPAEASEDTQFMNRLERGCYFDILKAQKRFGKFSIDQIKKVLGKDFEECWGALELTLSYEQDMNNISSDGKLYFIEWVAESVLKRQQFSESRANNRRSDKDMSNISTTQDELKETYLEDMGNGNGIEIKEGMETIKRSFEIFWNLYEKKVGKPKSLIAWQRLTNEERVAAMKYVPAYKLNKEKQFRKDPERFLKNKCWNDEIISSETNAIGETKHTEYAITRKDFYGN